MSMPDTKHRHNQNKNFENPVVKNLLANLHREIHQLKPSRLRSLTDLRDKNFFDYLTAIPSQSFCKNNRRKFRLRFFSVR